MALRAIAVALTALLASSADPPELPFGTAAFGYYEGVSLTSYGLVPGYYLACSSRPILTQPAALVVEPNSLDFQPRPEVEDDSLTVPASERSYEAVQMPLQVLPPEGGLLRTYADVKEGVECRWARAVPFSQYDSQSGITRTGYNVTFVVLNGSDWGRESVRCNPLSYSLNGPVARANPAWKDVPYCSGSPGALQRTSEILSFLRWDPSPTPSPSPTLRPSDGQALARADADETPTLPLDPPAPSEQHDVSISGFAFRPMSLMVGLNATVTWTNGDPVAHTTTSDDSPRVWDSGRLSQRESFTFRFTTPGAFEYFCGIHPFMRGAVIVAP